MKLWSISAHNTFRRCQRQYFFAQIMASHNAKDVDRREAHMLKQLRGVDEWRGHLVHLALERHFVPSLKSGPLIDREDLTHKTRAMARAQLEFSERRRYKDAGVTKTAAGDTFLALRDHEYGMPHDQSNLDALFEQIERCYSFLYAQGSLLSFLQSGEWYNAEPLLRFRFEEVWVNARLDLVMGFDRGKLCIVDWKIGESRTSDYSRQLRLYALTALNRWPRYGAEDLMLIEANLLQGKIEEHSVSADQLLETEDFVYRSLSDIGSISGDHRYASQSLEEWGYANSPLSCEYCKFERLCVRLSA